MSSFLNNSGDILLDAVLTDYGRQLLARGDGSFNIVKFAFGDDEVDYTLYDTGSTTPTVSKDTKIMNTPILEAMTNNIASLKSKLLTIANKNLLFLPVMKQNATGSSSDTASKFATINCNGLLNFNCHAVPVEVGTLTNSYGFLTSSNLAPGSTPGLLDRRLPNYIRVDQGLDSDQTDASVQMKVSFPDLVEQQYNVTIDNRFGVILDKDYTNPFSPTIDDDGMATYSFTLAGNPTYVFEMEAVKNGQPTDSTVIRGTRGTKLLFRIAPASLLGTTNAFDKYGFSVSKNALSGKCIKTYVKVTGLTTGYSVDIPVIFVKAS